MKMLAYECCVCIFLETKDFQSYKWKKKCLWHWNKLTPNEFNNYSTSPQHFIAHGRHLQLSLLLATNITLNYITVGLRMP